jgi:hypothetical protein
MACSSSKSTASAGGDGKVGDECTTTSECLTDLVCVFSHCHQRCERDKDCPDVARCVAGGDGHVCQLPEALACSADDDCNGRQVCGVDDECRDPCASTDDCTEGQLCAQSKQCASTDPKRDRIDAEGRIVRLEGDAGSSGAEKDAGGHAGDDAGTRGGNDAGGNAGHDAGTDSGAATDFTASDASNVGSEDLPAAPAKDLRIASDCSFDSDDGSFSCSNNTPDEDFAFAVVEPEGALRLGVMRVRSLQIDMGGVLKITGNLPLVVVADQTVRVFGRLSAASHDTTPYAGGFTSGNGPGAGQLGVVGSFKPSSGASFCGRGGRGAGVPDDTSVKGIESGPSYGNATLIPLLGGSGGAGESGGAGGGAIQVVAFGEIQVGATGIIDAGGGAGGNGSSGAGSGGGILLEAPKVTIDGVIAANGGGGGASVGGSGGEDGKPSASRAAGELPNLGGEGSAGDDPNGTDGMAMTNNNSLGGGGGAGRIRINTADGKAAISGTLSPSIASKCATLGKLP